MLRVTKFDGLASQQQLLAPVRGKGKAKAGNLSILESELKNFTS